MIEFAFLMKYFSFWLSKLVFWKMKLVICLLACNQNTQGTKDNEVKISSYYHTIPQIIYRKKPVLGAQ